LRHLAAVIESRSASEEPMMPVTSQASSAG
jgi:hypothetical protein